SVRAAWKNVVDCLLKLKRLKLLPPSVVDQDGGTSAVSSSTERLGHLAKSESGVIFPSSHRGAGTSRHMSGVIGRFSQFLSVWDQCRHAYVAQVGLVHAYEYALLANLARMRQLAFLACCSLRFWL
uniref:Uncharacterized protein n=1 Tax=Oryza glaberrima TaxID=4538 RepID=I1PUL0_ORYGL